jgi:5-formyltetrahydrofolate cyclo-ligase
MGEFPPARRVGDDAKPALRRAVCARRASLTPTERAAAGRAVAGHALALAAPAAPAAPAMVAAFVGVGAEPPTLPTLDALRAAGVAVLLPVVDGEALDWAPYEGAGTLETTARGLLEPATRRLGTGALRGADLVLAPAVLVDRRGHRLGRGGGYYDRALAAGVGGRVLALVYDDEVVDEVPHEPHDVPVDGALTPAGVVMFAASG